MNMDLQGFRTFIVAALAFAVPATARWGFKVDPNTVADAVIVIVPALMAILRSVTTTPPGKKE